MSYGAGTISFERGRYRVRIPDGKGGRITVGSYLTLQEAEQALVVAQREKAQLGVGMTLRQIGPSYLKYERARGLKSWKQIESTWGSIVCDAPFIDLPVELVSSDQIDAWALSLPHKKKKRSVLRCGERHTVELDKPISRKQAAHALSYLRNALDYAVKKLKVIDTNPADGVIVPADRNEQISDPIEFLPEGDVRKLLDFPQLTLEQRTVYTIAIFQCPREGEIAGMDWERVDWERGGWWIAKSWNGSTKNRKTRWQIFIEPALHALREWWEHRGRPARGIVFPSPQRGARGELKRYAKGHDWGWADTRWNNRKGALQVRPGMPARVGVSTRIRFHDTRDTCATHLLSGTWGAAWSVKAVSKHLGHANTAITEARYAHLTDRAQREHAASVRFARMPHAVAIQSPAQSPAALEGGRSQVLENAGSGGRART